MKFCYSGEICGYESSTAQVYAEKYGYTFRSLGAVLVPLELTRTAVWLRPGEQYRIDANQTVLSYASSSTAVAIVSPEGIVTGIGNGKAVITVYDAEFHTVQLTVTVSDAALEPGDVDGSELVDAGDASEVLIVAAILGAGGETDLTDAQKTAADVNGDGNVDAVDASVILQFAAALGAGEEGAKIEDFA